MRFYLLIAILFVSAASCYTYKEFVPVTPAVGVPKGSTEFVVTAPISALQAALTKNQVVYQTTSAGIETEEVLLDEGTRAMYKIYSLTDSTSKVVPFWGYTEKVASEVSIWAGSASAATMRGEMKRVVYTAQDSRPNKVFSYGVQIFSEAGKVSY